MIIEDKILVSSDTGYTRLCTGCQKRTGTNPGLIGKARTLQLVVCECCTVKRKVDKEHQRYVLRRTTRHQN